MRDGRWQGVVCGLLVVLAQSACSDKSGAGGGAGAAGGTGGGAVAGAAGSGVTGVGGGATGTAGDTGAGGGTAGATGTAGVAAAGGAAGAAGAAGGGGGAAGAAGAAGATGATGAAGAGGSCVTGYTPSAMGTCVWGPMPLDPGFQNMPAGAWKLERGAALMPTAAGIVEPGVLAFDKTAICAGGARARQTITMPSRAASEPFALRVASSGRCRLTTSSTSNDCSEPAVSVIMNGAATYFPLGTGGTACLGERAYGGAVDVVAQPAYRYGCSNPILDLAIDHVGIAPLATCPMPGTLPDGDFEATNSNWMTSASDGGTPNPKSVAEIQAGTGTNNSRAAHLRSHDDCQSATIRGPVSPPLASIPNLALQLTYRGTPGENLTVKLGMTTIASIPATSALSATARACVPENSKGMTQTAMLGLLSPLSTAVNCTPAHLREFVIDDLKFVTDPTCPAAAWVGDSGFERTDPARMWDVGLTTDTVQGGMASVALDTTAANAHSGARALKMSTNGGCSSASVFLPISIPMPTATAGPALTLFYRAAPALASSYLTLSADSTTYLADARGYTQVQHCLDPTLGGQTSIASLQLTGGFTDCTKLFPTESVWIDDVAVTTSPTCPTN